MTSATGTRHHSQEPARPLEPDSHGQAAQVVLSFDIEEHNRIEAAAGLEIDADLRSHYADRAVDTTRWLLDRLEEQQIQATFFIVGEFARDHADLVRDIHRAGHEVASHGWSHRRVLEMTPEEFREDLRQSKDALEQITGVPVVGYRAPTFSVVRRTAWALDVLVEEGLLYDSSIYPVRHDRYGVPEAPRMPFLALGARESILELPPVTWRLAGLNVPVGGGGYFRLFPRAVMEWGIDQTHRTCRPAVAMIYFHPWEFDPGQPRLPLGVASRFRTYVGIGRSRKRLTDLVGRHRFVRADDAARCLVARDQELTGFPLAEPWNACAASAS